MVGRASGWSCLNCSGYKKACLALALPGLRGYSNAMPKTAGQMLTDTLRSIKRVGPRTRTYRDGINVKDDMLDAIRNEVSYPGYYGGAKGAALLTARGVLYSWDKHVLGYRIDGELAYSISLMTPYQFAAFLGRMVDAGVENVGQGEYFFASIRSEFRASA